MYLAQRFRTFDSCRIPRLASRVFFSVVPATVMPFRRRCFTRIVVLGLLCTASTCLASTHPVHADHVMVVTVHQLATQVGLQILHAGGNAIDAAVATGFALAVVHSPAGNIGGGGFMLIRMADGKTHF